MNQARRASLERKIDLQVTKMGEFEDMSKFADAFYTENMEVPAGEPWSISRETMDLLITPVQALWSFLGISEFLSLWQDYLRNENVYVLLDAISQPTIARAKAHDRAYAKVAASNANTAAKRRAKMVTALDKEEVTIELAKGPSKRATRYELELFYRGCMEASHWYASCRDGIRAARNVCTECSNVAVPGSMLCEACDEQWNMDRYLRL